MDAYGPEDFALQLTDGLGAVLPWVGAAVAAAIGLFTIYRGIRAGVVLFREVSEDRGPGLSSADLAAYREVQFEVWQDSRSQEQHDFWQEQHDLAMSTFGRGGEAGSELEQADFDNASLYANGAYLLRYGDDYWAGSGSDG